MSLLAEQPGRPIEYCSFHSNSGGAEEWVCGAAGVSRGTTDDSRSDSEGSRLSHAYVADGDPPPPGSSERRRF